MIRFIGRRVGGVSFMLTLWPSVALAAPSIPYEPAAFAQAQIEGRSIVVETYAFWCLPCRLQAPVLDRLRSRDEFKDVLVFRIGEDAPKAAWKRFRLHGYGLLVAFKGTREIGRGAPTNEEAIVALFRQAL